MALIAVVVHPFDRFHKKRYLVQGLFEPWIEQGHIVVVHEGLEGLPPADIGFLHVDLTAVPAAYTEAMRKTYSVVVNGATRSIAKRAISRHLVARPADYHGAVIVKSDANCGGIPEVHHAQVAEARGEYRGRLPRHIEGSYSIYDSTRDVPADVWDDEALVVERFVPERDERGYAMRAWVFLGDAERCNRVVGPHPVVKAADVIERVPCEVPEALRARRAELGIDYGKLDFVVHDGEAILLDANRTPATSTRIGPELAAGMAQLSLGIGAFSRT